MTSFDDIIAKFNTIKDLISTTIVRDQEHATYALEFSKHLYEIKCCFVRISWKNKIRFLKDLINEVQDITVLSLLLKSIWNCRLKDAVLSVCQDKAWSSYDQVPIDHNRTVLSSAIKDMIANERNWFRSLRSEQQCLLFAELLSVAGGPIMWEMLKHLQKIYENNMEQQSKNMIECVVVNELLQDRKPVNTEITKKEQTPRRKSSATQILESSTQPFRTKQAQQELDKNLAVWDSTVKSIKDSSKLEQLELTYKDGTIKRMWKINRPKSDAVETLDFVQLLPSAIGKRILFHLPLTQLNDCARVNRYWAHLVDELRAELIVRQKIDVELEKLRENMLRHDTSLGLFNETEDTLHLESPEIQKTKDKPFCDRPFIYPLRLNVNKNKKRLMEKPPFRNIEDINKRLVIRGAADENIRKWCANTCKINMDLGGQETHIFGVFQKPEDLVFPSQLLSVGVNIPLNPPLTKDPTKKE
ncbi:uncharacterized protein LOC123657173 [Melitaea cinxia]|uniref:uncharacterized protein LOC123657173 n=1 Tax=Melitaea cinxia TaxID=113334 RepID=UPI001E26E9F2|nr:uncharacterized protein LOC123657173 [Melitaea cinxia]